MDKEEVDGLIKALRDNDEDIRRRAVGVLAQIGERAVEPLIKALEDEDTSEGVIGALIEIGDQRAVEPLIKALEDKNNNPYTRMNAALALGIMNEKRAFKPLEEALQDEELCVREASKEALKMLKG